MLASSTRNSLFPLAVLALSASLALSQQPPAQPAPSTAPAPATAPQPPPRPRMRPEMRPGMSPGGMRGNMRGGMMQRGNFRGGPGGSHRGGPGSHFRGGEHGPMGMGGIGPGGTWWKNPAVVQRLSLTADQTKKMDEIVEQSRLQLIDLRANLEKQQVMLEPMLSANPLDAAKASLQIDKVANARADLEKADAKMLLNIRGVLTPDQWTKLHERRAPDAQGGPAPAGSPGAAAVPGGPGGPGGGGRWRGPRSGGNGGMDNLVAPIDQQ